MKRCAWIVSVVAGVLVCGCADLQQKANSEQAQQRWGRVRARVKLQLAERAFTHAVLDEAFDHCREVVALDPELPEAYLLMTRIQLERGELAGADSMLGYAEALAPASPDAAYLRGVIAERRGQHNVAGDHFRRAYEAQPGDLDFLLAYAEFLVASDQSQEALELLQARCLDFEQDAAIHTLIGQAFSFLGRHDEAAGSLLLATQLAPQDVLLREQAGLALLTAGRTGEASLLLEPMLDDATASVSPSVIVAWAGALLDKDNAAEAIRVLRRGLDRHEADALLWTLYAKAHLITGEFDTAGYAASKAVGLAPDLAEAGLLLAYHALLTGRSDEAVLAIQSLLKNNPDDIEARLLYAHALEGQTGGQSQAVEQYRRVLALVPDHAFARARLDQLVPEPVLQSSPSPEAAPQLESPN